MLFNQVSVAKEWGKFPSELGLCEPYEDPIIMIAFTRQQKLMQAYENQLREDEANKPKPPKKR